MKLSEDFRKNFRLFMYYYTNGTLGFVVGVLPVSGDLDYREELLYEASTMETVISVYMNNIKMDENGTVLNQKHAMKRAAQYIRMSYDHDYIVEPEFESWEIELH